MFGVAYATSDIVSSALHAALIATFASGLLCLLGLSWTNERWRVPVALAGTALLASALQYLNATAIWLQAEPESLSAGPRYAGWWTVHPLQVAAMVLFARIVGPVPIGVFWRTTAAALLMVFCRWMGDAGFFNPSLGVLLSIGFWLYILGEFYFGGMAEAVRKGSPTVRIGYFWARLIMTIGWAIYPILHFVDVVIGTGYNESVITIYTVFDLINLITVSLIFLAVASKER